MATTPPARRSPLPDRGSRRVRTTGLAVLMSLGLVASATLAGCSQDQTAAVPTLSPSALVLPSASGGASDAATSEPAGDPQAQAYCEAYFTVDATHSAIVGKFVEQDYGSMKKAKAALKKQLTALRREGRAAALIGAQYAPLAKMATKAKKTNTKLNKGSSKVTDGDLTDALKSIEVACVNFGFALPNDNVQARADAGIS